MRGSGIENTMKYYAYIGTNSVRGSRGIYSVRIDGDVLTAEIVSAEPFYNAGSVALNRDESMLYAATEGMTFQGLADGGITGFGIAPDGRLTKTGGQRSHGQRTCCVALGNAEKSIYACNFFKGTMSIFDLAEDGSVLPARLVIDPPEDAKVKALHCVGPIPEEYVGVISLAECALVIYRADNGERVTSAVFPGKPFPRYFEACGRYIYAMMQMPDDIYVYESHLKEEGQIKLLQKISVMEEDFKGGKATSTIRVTPDGKWILAANRPSDTISIFRIQKDGILERNAVEKLPGKGPRDFHISRDGKIVVTALQRSDEISIHRFDGEQGMFREKAAILKIPSPASVAVGQGRMENVSL